MNTRAKLSAYGAVLALLVAGAWGIGSAVGPLSPVAAAPAPHDDMTAAPAPHDMTGTPGNEDAGHGDSHSGTVAEADQPAGLASSRGGYTLIPSTSTPTGGTFSFTVTGPGGTPVTAFDVEHDKRMHLVVVRRDTTGFQHVHPEMAPDGTWTVPLALPAGGAYRAFADFTPTGAAGTTLGTDLFVPGDFRPVAHAASRTSEVDGYTVTLGGDLTAGQASPLTLTVRRDGAPVTDLQPYLAAYGHLVTLREGDLAYLHVHPAGAPGDGVTPAGPVIGFTAEVPSAGTYRLFLDFRHGDVVRTAEFTVATTGTTGPAADSHTGGHAATDPHGGTS